MVMALQDAHKIENVLALVVRRYVRTQDRLELPAISSGLGYLLGHHWNSSGESHGQWFDGLVLEESVFRTRKANRLDVRGLMIWGEAGNDSRQWVDLFTADMRLEDGREELATYTLGFGQKSLEIGRASCRERV